MRKDVKRFVQTFKKSYDYPDTLTIIDAKDQQAAEEGTPKGFLSRIASSIKKGETIHKTEFQKGVLTLANKDANLYSGFFTDSSGQIVEKFDAHTLEMVAKTLIVKNRVTDYDVYGSDEDLEDDQPTAPSTSGATLKIKFGDIEIELKKSIKNFIDSYRNTSYENADILKKAVQSWRRSQKLTRYESDREAAQAIINDWEANKESFSQTVFAIKQGYK
jgi:hypothetical protein